MTRQSRPQPLVRYVYVIGPQQGLQKIGIATDPQSRLAALQTANPAGLIIHAAIPVPFNKAHAVESAVHRQFARARVRNEWFETSPAEAVAAVRAAAGPFAGMVTPAPDPAVIWPANANWRVGSASPAADGLPLFEYTRPAAPEPATVSKRRHGWWSVWRLIEHRATSTADEC